MEQRRLLRPPSANNPSCSPYEGVCYDAAEYASVDFLFLMRPGPPTRFGAVALESSYQRAMLTQWPEWGYFNYGGDLSLGNNDLLGISGGCSCSERHVHVHCKQGPDLRRPRLGETEMEVWRLPRHCRWQMIQVAVHSLEPRISLACTRQSQLLEGVYMYMYTQWTMETCEARACCDSHVCSCKKRRELQNELSRHNIMENELYPNCNVNALSR